MRSLILAVALSAVLGCSGGGGGSGGSASGSGSAAAEGPITGFGSVFVSGDRWNTDGAVILRDGAAVGQAELALGMVVRIEGQRTGPGEGRADRVIFDDEVEGPITAIRPDGPDRMELDVLGLTIVAERGRTLFDDTSFDGLSVGDLIEVSGLPGPDGVLLATFIEKKDPPVFGVSEVELEGVVDEADALARTFTIRGITIVVDAPGISTEIDDDLLPFVVAGDVVEVEGILDAADRILALEVDDEDDFGLGDDFRIEGLVMDFVSLADFKVGGIPVDASGAVFLPNRPDLVVEGARVQVEGDLRDGLLVADKVKLRGSEVRIHAEIASDTDIDVAGGSLVLLGIPIVVPDSVEIEDDLDDQAGFDLADLSAGDFLEVRGLDDGAGGVLANRIERDETDDVKLRGRIEDFDPITGTLQILGVVVPTDAGTEFEGLSDASISRSDFFDLLEVGVVVEVEDDEDGDETTIDVADEVEIENEDDEDDDDDDGDEFDD